MKDGQLISLGLRLSAEQFATLAAAQKEARKILGEAPKPRRKYTRRAKAKPTEPKVRAQKSDGQELVTPIPKPKRGRGRPRKVQAMVPPPDVGAEA